MLSLLFYLENIVILLDKADLRGVLLWDILPEISAALYDPA
jgi:hypothetical protein